jgi:hypothetical protein
MINWKGFGRNVSQSNEVVSRIFMELLMKTTEKLRIVSVSAKIPSQRLTYASPEGYRYTNPSCNECSVKIQSFECRMLVPSRQLTVCTVAAQLRMRQQRLGTPRQLCLKLREFRCKIGLLPGTVWPTHV